MQRYYVFNIQPKITSKRTGWMGDIVEALALDFQVAKGDRSVTWMADYGEIADMFPKIGVYECDVVVGGKSSKPVAARYVGAASWPNGAASGEIVRAGGPTFDDDGESAQ